jgi:tryptophan-rich sensory protein
VAWLADGEWKVVLGAAAWGIVVGGLGAALTGLGPWYYNLRKPSWQPPDWLFGPAWTLILTLAAVAGGIAWNRAGGHVSGAVLIALFVVNGTLNMGWSLLFFRLRHPDWALIEVVPLWLSIAAMIVGLAPASALASWLVVPYLLWVSFAAVLNWKIVQLNPRAQPGGG